MKGTYILLITITRDIVISVGKLGEMDFEIGNYVYIGSAMNNLETRITRHLKNKKKIFWHIDYLIKHASIKEIYIKPNLKKEECTIAKKFNKYFKSKKNFGSSDCSCISHLYFCPHLKVFKELILKIGFEKWVTMKN